MVGYGIGTDNHAVYRRIILKDDQSFVVLMYMYVGIYIT